MPSPADLLWEELDTYASSLEPRLKREFLQAVAKLRAEVTEQELLDCIRSGDPGPLLRRLDLGPFQHTFRQAVTDAAGQATASMPLAVNVDVFNGLVQRAMMNSELTLIVGLTTDIREGIRTTLTAGLANGVNPVDTARALRAQVGLTPKQVQSVANYRRLLTGGAKGQPYTEALRRSTRDARFDPTVRRAITERTPLQLEQVDKHVARFEERLLKQRAETVARTESIKALALGQHLRWRQAIESGKVLESELRRYWHVAKDERVCPVCKEIPVLNPNGVAFEQPFESPDGPVLLPPQHPNCRCVVFVRPQ